MKISELIYEAISFTQHLKEVETVINDAVKKSINNLSPDKFQKFRTSVNRSKNYASMSATIESELRTLLMTTIEQNLTIIGVDILSSEVTDYADYLSVQFKDLPQTTRGQATDFDIDINEDFIDDIIEQLVPSLIESASNSIYDEENMFDDFFQIIKNKQLQTRVINGWLIQGLIDDIASNFIHELVHVRQHIPQIQKGRDETEYRSYLDKTKGEFGKIAFEPQDSEEVQQRYWDLYISSPQEIAARAHQSAIKIIKNTELNAVTSIEELPRKNDIMADINQYAREQFKDPENPKEKQVFNRYVKLIYQEVDRYYDNLKNKLTNT